MIGEILDAKYRIDKQLGAGGMGNVYLATHLGTTRIVAVKVIAPRWASEPQFLARFQREAQACGRLRHPNIVNVTDFGIARDAGGDKAYLVMEFLDGQTLSDFQKANPRIGLPLIADLLDQIALALTEAHRHGIVHRDLKPDNIWLEPNGRGGYTVKVLDFGVAKMNMAGEFPPRLDGPDTETPITFDHEASTAGDEVETVVAELTQHAPAKVTTQAEESETVAIPSTPFSPIPEFDSGAEARTMPGSLIGTPAYMSPEQAFGKEIDFRSDIYSLAVVTYLLVCGQLPFTGKPSEFYERYKAGKGPTFPSSLKIPQDVADAIVAGLARNAADRPASAVAFAQRFHNAVDAEFLALRRSKAFLMQHLMAYILLVIPIYGTVVAVAALLAAFSKNLIPVSAVRMVVVPVIAAILFVFSDNVLRAAAALIAADEQVRVRRFLSLRVFWKLIKTMPVLAATQARSLIFSGPGWVVGDCLWPVICVVEKLKGKAAVERSRVLMVGMRSAGRALAIRHLALAAFSIEDVVKSLAVLWKSGQVEQANVVITSTWFPIFALYAAAPLFLYDRTAASERGPLLQLDRTPEVRINSRALSLSSIIWVTAAALDLLYQPLKVWLFGSH